VVAIHLAERLVETGSGLARCDKSVCLLAAAVKLTVVAGENLTVGSTIWLPAEGMAPGR